MTKSTVDPECTGQFSPLFLDYLRQEPKLEPFYNHYPTLENFGKAISLRNFDPSKRLFLVEVLQKQYSGLPQREKVVENIRELGQSSTFTVTTGHQLNLMSGPLYFVYKIISTINLAKKLKQTYPAYNFVPVYWMATEDHDFEEINHFHFDQHRYQWNSQQTGPVGEFTIDDELKKNLKEWQFLPDFFRDAYSGSPNLSHATRKFVDHLFGEEGLLILDANDKSLKNLFKKVIETDIFSQKANELIQYQNGKLEKLGYKTQVFPREINFFYLREGLRERIVKVNERFEVNGREDISWTEEALKSELREFPERFSPNVVMRPLYQECILPNLAYLGGPAEVAYWFQLKPVFDHYHIEFPLLMARNFVMMVPKILSRKIKKLGLSSTDLFLPFDQLRKQWVLKHAKEDVQLNGEAKKIEEVFAALEHKSMKVDPTLRAAAASAGKRSKQILHHLGQKLRKAEERKHTDSVRQLREIKDGLFPSGIPQERKTNLLNFYLESPGVIEELKAHLDPLDPSIIVLSENED